MIVLQAIGGSTNGLIHLIAMAGRAGVKVDLEAFDQLGRDIPVLLNLKPSGSHYMEHFHHAGGLPALMRELTAFLDLDA
jgi:dihydroxy-acid dehydratase